MIVGIISDTHRGKNNLARVMKEFEEADVEMIFHCGDIIQEDLDPQKFLGLPVICALVDDQPLQPAFSKAPPKWKFTVSGNRVVPFNNERAYVGHTLAWASLNQTAIDFHQQLDKLRKDHEWLRLICSGHTHLPFLNETGLVRLVNPGAVNSSISGYCEYAIMDTETNEVSFYQLYPTEPTIDKFIVGVISDSLRISQMDVKFWSSLAEEFKKREVKDVIHCGNTALPDIGRKELADFQVHYNLREDQKFSKNMPKDIPSNWHLVGDNEAKEPVVEINGYRFCIQLDLGATITQKSVIQTEALCLDLRRKYSELDFVLCGITRNCLFIGGYQPYVINPGDVINDRNFATIELGKRICITFGHVPIDPLS